MNQNDDAQRDIDKPMIEWIVGGISAAIVAVLLGFLVYEALFADSLPPSLTATIEALEPTDEGTVVRVAVTNGGDKAAAAVQVQCIVVGREGAEANREIELDYVAGHGVRRGAFIFAERLDPQLPIEVEIVGYTEP